jgi:hypothetical protein
MSSKVKQSITEEMNIHKEWYEEAEKQDITTLQSFIQHLINDYHHDYGTICHAITAAAIASAKTVNRSGQGGITGFQASCIMWEFITRWMRFESPMKLLDYDHMLYPQYANDFHSMSKDTWRWIQDEAKKRLTDSDYANETVKAHWQTIMNGIVPFGYEVRE